MVNEARFDKFKKDLESAPFKCGWSLQLTQHIIETSHDTVNYGLSNINTQTYLCLLWNGEKSITLCTQSISHFEFYFLWSTSTVRGRDQYDLIITT